MNLPYILLAVIFLTVAHAATIPVDLVAQESEQNPIVASAENGELVRSKRGLLLAKGLLLGGGLLAGKAALVGGGILGAKAVGAGLLGASLYNSKRYGGYGGWSGGYSGYGGYRGGWSSGYGGYGGHGGYYSSW